MGNVHVQHVVLPLNTNLVIHQRPVADAAAVEIMDGYGPCAGCSTVCTHVVGPVGAGLCDNCRAPKTPIDREAATVFVTSPGRGSLLPLVTLHCLGCAHLVDVIHGNLDEDNPTFGVSRVNGDSKYGYEPYHLACMN